MELNKLIGEVVDYDSLLDAKSNIVAKVKSIFSMLALAPIAA